MLKDNMEEIKNKIWELFRLLRGEINTADYSIVLLLINLQSNNLLAEILRSDTKHKESLIKVLDNTNNSTLSEVFKVFLPTIKSLGEQTISQILEILNSIDPNLLQKNIVEIYDDSLDRIVLSQGRESGGFIQPNQLTEFINSYIGSTKDKKIFNPFSGAASLIKDCNESKSIYAQEINPKTWAIGQLRLIINESNANYKCDDSIMNWPTNMKFDLIVSSPPFGLRLNGANRDKYPEFRNAEDFLLGISVNSLSEKGQVVAVLPTGILFREGRERRIREDLIQNDLIDAIISFPGGLLHNTNIPFVIVILNKAKKHSNIIKIVNAEPFVSKPSIKESFIKKESFINVKELLKAANNNESHSVRIISNQDVIKNNFNLNIARYFQEEIDGVRLRDILNPHRGTRIESQENGRFIRIRDLKNDTIDFHLNIKKIDELPINKPGLKKIVSSCLLLASRWKTLKPTYFHFQNEPIAFGSGILAFHVKESEVDINFLVNELHADYVQKQFESFLMGTTIPFVRRDDLLEIKIKLPSIEEQRAKVTGIKEISKKIDRLQNQISALKYGESIKEFNEFASLKHTLGRPRQNILGWSKNLTNFFVKEKNAVSSLNDEFRNLFDKGIIEAITEINRDIKFISDVLEKGENGLVLKDYDKTIISLEEINNMIENISSNEFNFSIKKQSLEVDEIEERGILVNKLLLKTLIDNLLTNANKYGFIDKKEGNQVMIELNEIDDKLTIDVRNNGLPFHKNFDREKFITKFKTAELSNGSGLGGYDINRIATYFENENWELELNNPIYPVIFRFSFSIKPMN